MPLCGQAGSQTPQQREPLVRVLDELEHMSCGNDAIGRPACTLQISDNATAVSLRKRLVQSWPLLETRRGLNCVNRPPQVGQLLRLAKESGTERQGSPGPVE